MSPSTVHKCARACGGAEANEIAARAMYALTGGRVLTIGRAYHGGTARMIALSDARAFNLPRTSQTGEQPRVPPAHCYRCPWGKKYPGCGLECAEAVDQAARDDATIRGVLMEAVIGSGGVIVPPQDYFDAIQEVCERRGLTLILDEVMTGCGRVGRMFA